MTNEEFDFYNKYIDVVDEINYLTQSKKIMDNEKDLEPSPRT